MKQILPNIYIARHGETEWSLSGQHTGRTDIPLTERGRQSAVALALPLKKVTFVAVFTSPSLRARTTCELAGFGSVAQIDPDLAEWDYGQYEGLLTDQIQKLHPGWDVFRDGCPGGESVADITARADRVVARLRTFDGNVLFFSSGHISRVIATRWLGLPALAGKCLMLSTGSLSILSYEHNLSEPAIKLWNDCTHVGF